MKLDQGAFLSHYTVVHKRKAYPITNIILHDGANIITKDNYKGGIDYFRNKKGSEIRELEIASLSIDLKRSIDLKNDCFIMKSEKQERYIDFKEYTLYINYKKAGFQFFKKTLKVDAIYNVYKLESDNNIIFFEVREKSLSDKANKARNKYYDTIEEIKKEKYSDNLNLITKLLNKAKRQIKAYEKEKKALNESIQAFYKNHEPERLDPIIKYITNDRNYIIMSYQKPTKKVRYIGIYDNILKIIDDIKTIEDYKDIEASEMSKYDNDKYEAVCEIKNMAVIIKLIKFLKTEKGIK